MTEKQVESYLETQTRKLPLPDGSVHVMTGMNLMWEAVDFITGTYTYTLAELVDLTQRNQEKQNCTFEESFKRVVAYIDKKARS
ncbi:MAG: hypothetical protein P8P30_11100 [Rickettsiales bacterium]|nr:hypothetical protein [Rickettsiales bacterium]